MSAWRPIDTAPMDGTHVLLYGTYQWEDYIHDESQRTGAFVGFFNAGDPKFEYSGSKRWELVNANPYVDYCQPTHWQPLPPPPQ